MSLTTRFLSALEGLDHGRLSVRLPDGATHRFGAAGPEVDLEIRDWSVLPRLAARGDVGFGEAWIDGHWQSSSLEGLLTCALRNADRLQGWVAPGRLANLRMAVLDRVLAR